MSNTRNLTMHFLAPCEVRGSTRVRRAFAKTTTRRSAKPRYSNWLAVLPALFCCLFFANCADPDAPVITSISPEFAPAETLVTIEGTNLDNITSMKFDGQLVNFNTAFNSDNALLFRVPTTIDAGTYTLTLTTDGGTAETTFRISLDAPEIFLISPNRGPIGSTTTLFGENFFEPLEVYFPMGDMDSVQADIVSFADDSIRVTVPEGATQGNVALLANGGYALSANRFQVGNVVVVNDFDGNGVRSDVAEWRFTPMLDQTAADAVRSSDPDPISGNFLKISGRDTQGSGLIGSVTTQTNDPTEFANFGLTTSLANTLIEFDVNTNGHPATRLVIILKERDGSRNDFSRELRLDQTGWTKITQPLSRFEDLNGAPIDVSKVASIRFLLFDFDNTGEQFEVNIDNLLFSELL